MSCISPGGGIQHQAGCMESELRNQSPWQSIDGVFLSLSEDITAERACSEPCSIACANDKACLCETAEYKPVPTSQTHCSERTPSLQICLPCLQGLSVSSVLNMN